MAGYHPHPEMQTPPNMGQPRQGPPNQNPTSTKAQQQLCDPQLAQYVLNKGNFPSWKDVKPDPMRVSQGELRRQLERMQSKNSSVSDRLKEIKSPNAISTVNFLIKDANDDLQRQNSNMRWVIASVELTWKPYNYSGTKKQLRCIDLILQTETLRPVKPGKGSDSQDARSQHPNEGHDQGQKFNPLDGRAGQDQGPMHVHPQHPPPPPPPPMNPNMMHQHPIAHEYQGNTHPGPHIDVLDPLTRQQEKAKKSIPGEFPVGEDDSELDTDILSMASYSAESTDEGRYNIVRGRSRSVSRNKNKNRAHGGWRKESLSRSRAEKLHKNKSPHPQMRSDFYPPPLGEHSRKSSKQHSPKSSTNSLAPNIKISVNNTATPSNSGENDREQTRGRDDRRSHNGIHGGARPNERPDAQHWDGKDRVFRRSSYDMSPLASPRDSKESFTKSEKVTPQPMSRNSSSSYSETVCSRGTSSTRSTAEDSVFDEPTRFQRKDQHHSNIDERVPISSSGAWRRSNKNEHHQFDRRGNPHVDADDYPDNHRQRSRRHHKRPIFHQGDGFHDGEYWYPDHDSGIVTWPQAGHAVGHRVSMGAANPFNTNQFPSQRSLKYTEHPYDHIYPYYASQKALPEPQMHPDSFSMDKIFQAGVEALHRQEASAYDHIRQSRRPLGRRNALSGGGYFGPTDSWANPTYPFH